MSIFEIISLLLGLLNSIVVAIGLFFAYKQIKLVNDQIKTSVDQTKLLIETHSDNHEWNRRYATQELLFEISQSSAIYDVINKFLYLDRTTPISKDELFVAFSKDETLQNKTAFFLNALENLARGVKYGVYDEEIVKNARWPTMKRTLIIFHEYIEHWRKQNYASWREFEELTIKWDGQVLDYKGKEPIGINKNTF